MQKKYRELLANLYSQVVTEGSYKAFTKDDILLLGEKHEDHVKRFMATDHWEDIYNKMYSDSDFDIDVKVSSNSLYEIMRRERVFGESINGNVPEDIYEKVKIKHYTSEGARDLYTISNVVDAVGDEIGGEYLNAVFTKMEECRVKTYDSQHLITDIKKKNEHLKFSYKVYYVHRGTDMKKEIEPNEYVFIDSPFELSKTVIGNIGASKFKGARKMIENRIRVIVCEAI